MPATQSDAPVVPLLVGGKWRAPDVEPFTPVHNPSTGEVIARTPLCGPREVDAAVTAAANAFPDWAGTPAPKRAQVMFRFRTLLEERFEELAALVTREN